MAGEDIHVYPINDLHEHFVEGPGCGCGPEILIEGATLIYLHNSWDHREIVEEAIRIMNGEDEE